MKKLLVSRNSKLMKISVSKQRKIMRGRGNRSKTRREKLRRKSRQRKRSRKKRLKRKSMTKNLVKESKSQKLQSKRQWLIEETLRKNKASFESK